MTSLRRPALVLSLTLLASTLACSGVAPPDEDTAADDVKSGKQQCNAKPAPTARCSSACPYGYKGASGSYSCECCSAPAVDAGTGEVCGNSPPNARCSSACPGGRYKQIGGQPTCVCCGT